MYDFIDTIKLVYKIRLILDIQEYFDPKDDKAVEKSQRANYTTSRYSKNSYHKTGNYWYLHYYKKLIKVA